jgi:3-hydroxyisobutyrate dehydrogenase
MSRQRIGIVGVGNMGSAMAERLLGLGWPVAVRDVVPEREAALGKLGAKVCASPAALASGCDAVIVAVVDAGQTRRVLFDADGVVAGARRGACVLLCPTMAPADTERCAARLAERGIDCIDAPMSGGPERARGGQMSLMVACAEAVFERQRALLEALSTQVIRLGARIGDGARTKLVNNLLAGINLAGAAEALALAERLGLDLARTLDVIERSSGQSWIGIDRMRRAMAGDYAPRAHTALLNTDTHLALEMAAAVGQALPLGAAAAARFEEACAEGHALRDDASLFELARDPRRR